ncbi:efflux RND transporter periplasmic adaptor subunit [Falsihalocynthiibacter arcticus]|uniref:efflux RND transporter periplasmic adaptor subunit n=1 Tax=Falsihalocynthiibacter arcticus TaxID=1579316 RepID=UPI0009EEF8BA|nr:efflux RND transporter periplasmic adaptor subunit [Falsihalocynthiibacter arcticus]
MKDTLPTGRTALVFESDSGSTRSRWVAGGLAIAIVAWMGSGFIFPSTDTTQNAQPVVAPRAVTVAVQRSIAETVEQVFVAEGQALPDRDTMIRAEISGEISEVLVDKGVDLEAGQIIARFDTASQISDLARAQGEFARAQRESDTAAALLERGVATADRVAQASATLAAAQSGVTLAQEAIGNSEIRAPFAGRLESLDIDVGEYVSTGDSVGRIVDNRSLTIRIQIPQQSLRDIQVGQKADVAFITGAIGSGLVDFVGSSADAATRTFIAEIEVSNADGSIPAGISAQLRIITGELTAHFISPAILSLGTDGALGIKTVDSDNRVVFHKVGIVRAQTDGIWVSGLPDDAQIISIGQGFVNDGEIVDPQPDTTAEPASPAPETASQVKNGANGQIIETKPNEESNQ